MSLDYLEYKSYNLTIATSLKDLAKLNASWKNLIRINNSSNVYVDPNYFTTQFNSRSPGYKPYLVFFSKAGEDIGCIIAKTKKKSFPLKFGYLRSNTTELNALEIEIDGVLSNKSNTSEEIITNYLQDLIINKEFEVIEFQHFSERNFLWHTLKFSDGAILRHVVQIRSDSTAKRVDRDRGSLETPTRQKKLKAPVFSRRVTFSNCAANVAADASISG